MRGEREDHSLETTGLINEAYLRLVDASRVEWRDRVHFLAVSARVMRHVVIDYARARQFQKRGGGQRPLPLDTALDLHRMRSPDLIRLDDALTELAKLHPRKAKVVEMRFFGGSSMEEIATALGVSLDTIERDWRLARVWLHRELSNGSSHDR